MTLDTSLINRESRDLYLRYLKDPKIPDELCSEIYMEFINCLKKERSRGRSRISGGGIGQLIKLATKTIFHRNKQQDEKELVLNDIVGRHASRLWNSLKSNEEIEFFDRIAWFLKEWARRKKIHATYLQVFLLYHAFHLNPDTLRSLAPASGMTEKELLAQTERIKESIRARVNEKLERKMKLLGLQYFNLVKRQIKMGDLRIEQYDCSDEEYETSKRKRKKALETIREMKFFPSWVEIEGVAGITERKARYAYQTVIRAVKESFKDDTYWGG